MMGAALLYLGMHLQERLLRREPCVARNPPKGD